MKKKRLFLIILFSLFCIGLFAEDSYKLSVVSADNMAVSEEMITLEGRVEVSFIAITNDTNQKERSLKADKVIIDVDNKKLDALGNVFLTEGKDSTFQGDALSLNWDTLDVVVFGGTSSSDRKNASGNNVKFFTVGDRISYSGKNDAVFFEDGVIGTREKDPYWSIKAKKIALADSDIFFTNATLRLGRVPLFWFPAFFYPGNRLSFNPAIGVSSLKGRFLNTTYELYGSYKNLSTESSSTLGDKAEDDASVLASNFLSFLGSDSDEEMIRSGWSYIPLSDVQELSDLQKWAYDTGSYFAVFADAWEKNGLSIGFDTYNKFLKQPLTVSAVGILSSKDQKNRYALDLNATYKFKNINFTFNLPLLSDPDVKYDYLNRNTVFGIDSIFKVDQSFPSTYKAGIKTYSIVLDGSTSTNWKGYSFDLKSLKSQINYEWNSKEQKYVMKDATLPYISFSSKGTFFNIKGTSSSKEVENKFSNGTAQRFYEEYLDIAGDIPLEGSYESTTGISLKKGTSVNPIKNVVSEAGSAKVDYSYNQIVDNDYVNQFEHSSLYTKIDGSINLNGTLPGNWISISDSITPTADITKKEKTDDVSNFKLKNVAKVSSPKIGLTYGLSNFIYLYEKSSKKDVDRWGKWDKTDITEHYLTINKNISTFKFGLKYVLPPLEQILTPSVSYSDKNLTVSADLSMGMEKESYFKPTLLHANSSYKDGNISFTFNNTYDFKKQGDWEGYTGSESTVITFLESKLKLTQTLSLVKKFEVKQLSFNLDFGKSNVQFSMKDKDLKADKLKLNLFYDVTPIYMWKNRIGLEGVFDFGFVYDFQNKYSSSLYADAKLNFAIYKFLDLSLSVKSVNNSFYRYYEMVDGVEKFSYSMLFKDLKNSFDFVGNGRKSTGFNLSSFSISAVHYMEDWTLTLTSSSQVKTVNGKSKFVPEFTFLIKWNAIPELKTTNKWNQTSGWEKK